MRISWNIKQFIALCAGFKRAKVADSNRLLIEVSDYYTAVVATELSAALLLKV